MNKEKVKQESFLGKLKNKTTAILKQGLSPQKAAWSVALGITASIFPIPGTSTLICVGFSAVGRLNPALIQIVNYAVSPLQFLLIIPFIRLGETIFGLSPLPFSPGELLDKFSADFFGTSAEIWQSLAAASLAWLLCAVPLSIVCYFAALPVLTKIIASYKKSGEKPTA